MNEVVKKQQQKQFFSIRFSIGFIQSYCDYLTTRRRMNNNLIFYDESFYLIPLFRTFLRL